MAAIGTLTFGHYCYFNKDAFNEEKIMEDRDAARFES